MKPTLSYPDLAVLLPSWELSLFRAERKSPQTVKSYAEGVRAYLAYCAEQGLPARLDRWQFAGFVDHLLASGRQPATAVARQLGVRRFSAWLVVEDELDADQLLGVKAPKLDEKVIEPLSDDDLRLLLKACHGKEMRDRRDEALVRLMLGCGARVGEDPQGQGPGRAGRLPPAPAEAHRRAPLAGGRRLRGRD